MKILRGFFSVLFFVNGILLHVHRLEACEPCQSVLTLEETIQRADVIAVAEKISDGPHTDPREDGFGGPDWIEVQLKEIWKGELNKEKVRVNSWDAMCDDYGLSLKEGEYVVFLSAYLSPSLDGSEYAAVNNGCSIKSITIKQDKVSLPGKRIMSIDDFQNMIQER